ncbi:MAG: SusC/RagA family TonB-linked outer membrane protein [Bacteroidales bacterium]|nr:SusC/RagA family TonB-linked outer membrane protein [Bacteroidales bacterium]
MKKFYTYIILPLLLMATAASAQDLVLPSQLDSIVLGNQFGLAASGNASLGASVFEKSPEVDIAKALYGQFSGLLVKQGTGRSEENQSKLRLHGHSPLILVDGFPRELNDLTGVEIESITVLKDAAAAALYGVKGANGVIMITTKRGQATPLKVTAKYQYGLAMATRTPQFADAYTYAYLVNQACDLDGIARRYTNDDLNAFYYGTDPYGHPNVNWWNQIFRNHGDNHRAQFTFTGGNRNFRYFAAIDYLKDDAMYVKPTADDRYNAKVYDNRLGIRANVDVNITDYTAMKLGVMARLSEFNTPQWTERIEKTLYRLPSAAFPIKQADGTYGGTSNYGDINPVAQHQESGQHQYSQTKVLADLTLRQDLSPLVPGLYADISVAFDYIGRLTETASKSFRYSEIENGVQKYYGTNSKTVSYSHWFSALSMKFELQGRLNYSQTFDEHHVEGHVAYRHRSWIENEQNASSKTQEILGSVSYNWKQRIFADVVVNYSGSAYLQPGKQFNWYPAVNLAGIVLQEPFVKVFGSFGLSGSDGDLEHELWRQAYSDSNGMGYYFLKTPKYFEAYAEDDMAATILAPERAATLNFGVDTRFFANRLSFRAEGFMEDRTNILIDPSNISGVLGVGVNAQSLGEYKYKGVDLSLGWDDKLGDFEYGVYGNAAWLFSEVVNDGQAYQPYDYLYHKGNPVGQNYGLEVIGFFKDQADINNSPKQTFGEVRPGDLKYRDQNNDGIVDDQDYVKMFGSSTPMLQYGFGLHASYKGFTIYADFQGQAGVTVDLTDSPLYTPLRNNSNISMTFLNREIPWTPETADTATMPRLTTQSGSNNYCESSQWFRDGSFLKLRNLGISYNIPRSVLKICDATVSITGTNLFCVDNIKFTDPEQLGAYYPTTRVIWAGVKFNF